MKTSDFKSLLEQFILSAQKANIALGFIVADITTSDSDMQMVRDKFTTNLLTMSQVKDIASITYGDNPSAQVILCKMNHLIELTWTSAKCKRLLPTAKAINELRLIHSYDKLENLKPSGFHAIKHETPMLLSLSTTDDEYNDPILQIEISNFPVRLGVIFRDGELMHSFISDDNIAVSEDAFHTLPMLLIDIISGGCAKFNMTLHTTRDTSVLRIELDEKVYYFIHLVNESKLEVMHYTPKMEEILEKEEKQWMFDHISASNQLIFRVWESTSYPEYVVH